MAFCLKGDQTWSIKNGVEETAFNFWFGHFSQISLSYISLLIKKENFYSNYILGC